MFEVVQQPELKPWQSRLVNSCETQKKTNVSFMTNYWQLRTA